MNFPTKPFKHVTVIVGLERAELWLGVEKVRLVAATEVKARPGGGIVYLTLGRRSFEILRAHRIPFFRVCEGCVIPDESSPTEDFDLEVPPDDMPPLQH